MDKNTVLAIILSSVVLIGGMFLQPLLFPAPEQTSTPSSAGESLSAPIQPVNQANIISQKPPVEAITVPDEAGNDVFAKEEFFVIETRLARITFTNRGGDIVSYELLEHDSNAGLVQMAENITPENRAFSVSFGGPDAPIIDDVFLVKKIDNYTIGFFKKFTIANVDGTTSSFTMAKQYAFKPDDYLFELSILFDGDNTMRGLDFNNVAYTLRTPPQIGPAYDPKQDRYEYRRFIAFTKDKRKSTTLGAGQAKNYTDSFKWIGVAGKYFTVLAVPSNATMNEAVYTTKTSVSDQMNTQVFLVRSPLLQQKTQDVYYMYVGPRTESALSKYNSASNNTWKIADLRLNDSMESSGVLGWLEAILKWLMELFYKLIPNWGVSIILLTVLTKVLFFPLTKKSSMATLKMQVVQPRMKELQEKYKSNPEKMNVELAKLYKEMGYNPLSGCLPMLIQFPLIIAMYNLFNNYFEFRGAMFIPGWIPDLSVGDSLYTLSFSLPFLGNQVRILPVIYVITQLLFGKITQAPGAPGQTFSMKIMMYGMPLFFFFIFYNAPSGLLLYWTFSNVLSMIQQVIINKMMHRHKTEPKSGLKVIK